MAKGTEEAQGGLRLGSQSSCQLCIHDDDNGLNSKAYIFDLASNGHQRAASGVEVL